jgi:quercetin dioxygenase-like cupin family protein
MPPGTKVLSHWHDDREAVFYCVRGEGLFVLDDVERTATPGSAMLQPVRAIHGFRAGSDEFHFLDFALFTDVAVVREAAECFTHVDQIGARRRPYGSEKPLFGEFANPAIRFVGERRVEGTFTGDDVEAGTEQILLVLEGDGELELLDQSARLRPGSILYLIADLPFAVTGRLRTIGASSVAGRIPEPPLFARLRER